MLHLFTFHFGLCYLVLRIQAQSIKLNILSFLIDSLLKIRFYFCSYFHIVSIIMSPGQKLFHFQLCFNAVESQQPNTTFKPICPRRKRNHLKFICAQTLHKSWSYMKHHIGFRNVTSLSTASILSATITKNVSNLKNNDFWGAFVNKSWYFCA